MDTSCPCGFLGIFTPAGFSGFLWIPKGSRDSASEGSFTPGGLADLGVVGIPVGSGGTCGLLGNPGDSCT
eukprot:1879200-Pyramimonas_sp.AAC.1